MEIVNYGGDYRTALPVSGAGTALVSGALLKGPVTPATDNGHLLLATGSSATPDIIGILREAHAVADDTTTSGTIFKTHPVDLIVPGRVVRAQYGMASADLITCTQAVSTTTMTVTSLEDDIDAAFVYVVSGLGLGQINYLTAATSGACTLKAAFGTSLDATSKFIKILPRFHRLASWSADGTKLTSQAAAGGATVVILDTYIAVNGQIRQLNPVNDAALTGLNSQAGLKFYADLLIRDTIPYSID